jgi:hypothetical protein
MTSIAYGAGMAAATPTAPARKSWFRRFIAALQDSRMKQARREIAAYRHLLPSELEWAGNRISYKNEHQLPFVR